jgi:CRP-like cAMP-binding protein
MAATILGAAPRYVSVIDADADLAERLPPDDLRSAGHALRARTLTLPDGEWVAEPRDSEGIGWLVVSGLVGRIVRVGRRESLELLAPGDLIQPGFGEPAGLVESDVCWRALDRVTVAHLDERFCAALRAWPQLGAALSERGLRRARSMAIQAAVNAHPTIEERLMLTLAHLGERMGRMTADGVLLELPLSHRLLAQCVQALRPSVTAGLLRLREDGRLLQPRRGQWLITRAGLDDVALLCRQEVVVC